jgi:hypothetical protein
MKKIISTLALVSLSMVSSFSAQAEEQGLDAKNFFLGGGIAFNSLPGFGSSRGFQFFGGYEFDFKINDDISTALEVGYMDTGDFDAYNGPSSNTDAKGLWVAALESIPLSSKTDMLVRLGFDFGDDDGLLLGTGLQYKFNTKLGLRMEYIARQNVNSLQANVYVKF